MKTVLFENAGKRGYKVPEVRSYRLCPEKNLCASLGGSTNKNYEEDDEETF